ncbi:MAG: PTS sugar transporter subunit IIA [bacterium]|nr:PTS sugar transporter subunit IIA [bacterium]
MQSLFDLILPENVFLDISGKDKYDVIHQIIQRIRPQGAILDPAAFEAEVVRREQDIPTGLQMGAALPHARSKVVSQIVMAFARLEVGVDFGAETDKARLIFLFGVPNDQINDYLKLVAQLCRLLKQTSFRKKLLHAQQPAEVIELLRKI